MKYKHFPAPFFNHFIQPSPPTIAKLKSLHGALMVHLFVACPRFDNFKIPPNLYALPSPINMATMIRQNTEFPPTARSSRQT